MAAALGIETTRIYSLTFAHRRRARRYSRGMFALTAAISPFFGQTYTPLAFITVVIGGGANAILGLIYSALYFAGVQTVATNVFNQYLGYVSDHGGRADRILDDAARHFRFIQKRPSCARMAR